MRFCESAVSSNVIKFTFSVFDKTEEDVILKWLDIPLHLMGSTNGLIQAFDSNSQGFTRLDRLLGKLLIDKAINTKDGMPKHHIFGYPFRDYMISRRVFSAAWRRRASEPEER